MESATLAGGCFWCLEAVFELIEGVGSVESGYTGGTVADPDYHLVCSGATGHAEAIRISYDPKTISYRKLLEIFFAYHDPTTLNRQGPDRGTQYRSAIFTHSERQKATAELVIQQLDSSHIFEHPIVTTIEPVGPWYPAELYHQQYYQRNSGQPYCQAMITPKLAKLRAELRPLLKNRAQTPGRAD